MRYFFDTFNGKSVHDDVGCLLPDLRSARLEARRLLQEMVETAGPEKDSSEFRTDVRDESGRRLFSATMVLMFERA